MPERVTAVIPLHNHRDWVWQAAESFARQSHGDKALVVIDDGSTDGSRDAVLSRLYRPQRVLIRGLGGPGAPEPECHRGVVPNTGVPALVLGYAEARGPAFARNRGVEIGLGLAEFRADYFAFLDSDDLYLPGKVARSLGAFRKHKHVGVVYSDYETFRAAPEGVLRVREFKEPFCARRLTRDCIVNCDSLVSRAAMEYSGGFDEQLRVAEDYDLWLRLSEKFPFWHLPEALVAVRVGGHSSTDTVPGEVWKSCHQRVAAKARARAN